MHIVLVQLMSIYSVLSRHYYNEVALWSFCQKKIMGIWIWTQITTCTIVSPFTNWLVSHKNCTFAIQ